MKTRIKIAAAVLAVASLGLAACSSDSASTEETAAATAEETTEEAAPAETAEEEASAMMKACQVTDVGGVDDKGFNQ